jgi:hypothetical protein
MTNSALSPSDEVHICSAFVADEKITANVQIGSAPTNKAEADRESANPRRSRATEALRNAALTLLRSQGYGNTAKML